MRSSSTLTKPGFPPRLEASAPPYSPSAYVPSVKVSDEAIKSRCFSDRVADL